MKLHPDHIKFIILGETFVSYPLVEQQVKRELFRRFHGSTMVICIDYDSGDVLDELPLNVLFNE